MAVKLHNYPFFNLGGEKKDLKKELPVNPVMPMCVKVTRHCALSLLNENHLQGCNSLLAGKPESDKLFPCSFTLHSLNHLHINKPLQSATEMFPSMDKSIWLVFAFADCPCGHDGAVPAAV